MSLSTVVRTIHAVACSEATQAAIEHALNGRDCRVARIATVDELRRRYLDPSKRGDCIIFESREKSLHLTSLIDLRRSTAEVPILVLAAHWSQATLTAALRCGATDLIACPLNRAQFIQRLDEILTERLPASIRIDRPQRIAGLSNLTRCEGRVLECVLSAMTTQQISRQLHVGAQTVAKHKQQVLRKLGARNDVELILQIIGNERDSPQLAAVGERRKLSSN